MPRAVIQSTRKNY